ncbi:MAG: M48 family metallopeptidase [Candidatus Lokiarchaeota archaeon]|nr:M48 family metallopeptidase [Candidatus Lokiarchaeota archaeon]
MILKMDSHHIVKFGKKNYRYKIEKTHRKTVGIIVDPDGSIIVRAPYDMEENIVIEAVNRKRKWIADKIKYNEKVKPPIPKIQEPISGEIVRYKNNIYHLQVHNSDEKKTRVVRVCRTLHVYVNEDLSDNARTGEIKNVIVDWYKNKARKFITKRVRRYSHYLKQVPKGIKIREIKLRWGSCTPEGILLFNWRIMMAPVPAIDYVVIHELSHLHDPDHSASFWDMVESLQPTYRKWKEWLHIYGKQLDLRW